MARKFLYGVALAVVLVIGGLLGLRFWARELSQFAFVPAIRFEAPAPTTAQTYADPRRWISRGEGSPTDPARWSPSGVPAPAPVEAAVFFVHPTSYFDRARWNAAPNDALANSRAELFVRGLASPFAGADELWAPRYAQATFGAFLSDKPEARQALAVAHAEVLAAFDHFIDEADPDLPIVLVGHSQGSLHLLHLLRERVAGTPLAKRVVAAYVIGWPVSLAHDLPLTGLAACESPEQTGCLLSWQSFGDPADPAMVLEGYARFPGLDGHSRKGSPFLCTNPLTGMSGGSAPAVANLGTLVPNANLTGATLARGLVGASCGADGLLHIGQGPDLGSFVMPGNNYHVYDIPLFWANLRADFVRRTQAWHEARQASRRPEAPRVAQADGLAGRSWWRRWF